MMRFRRTLFAGLGLAFAFAATAAFMPTQDAQDDQDKPQVATVGEKAPNFTLTNHEGKEVSLSDYKGKIVVLEWFNPMCPYVVYHYRDGRIQAVYKEMKEKDENVEWLLINSGGPGKQGHGVELNKRIAEEWKIPMPVLFDEEGTVGRQYRARTTPHVFLIDTEGVLVYQGALDNAPNGRVSGGGEKINYIQNAFEQVLAGETVSPAETRPYG